MHLGGGIHFGYNASNPHNGGGRTLTHETGHWLNVYHTFNFQAFSCIYNDYVDDTPICHGVNYADFTHGCTPHPYQCTAENTLVGSTDLRQIENYMDYSDDLCMSKFTNGQAIRMQATLFDTRKTIISSRGCGTPTHCSNGIHDGNEAGIDCGGSCPNQCGVGNSAPACTMELYPDEPSGFNLNNFTGNYATSCVYHIPIYFRYNGKCTKVKDCYKTVPCSQDPTCSWLEQQMGLCVCSDMFYDFYVSVYYGCDNNYNCAYEYGKWFSYKASQWPISTFLINQMLPFNFQSGNYYRIKLAIDANCISGAGGWRWAF